jgi:hypothetical protein
MVNLKSVGTYIEVSKLNQFSLFYLFTIKYKTDKHDKNIVFLILELFVDHHLLRYNTYISETCL